MFRHVTRYTFGSEVFLKLRDDRLAGMITTMSLRPTGTLYCVAWGDASESWHHDFELVTEFVPSFADAD